MKVIFHLDVDSYFVSAERTIHRELQNKSIVISDCKPQSIISAASYEAKNKGIYVPMLFYKARKIDPLVICIQPNFKLYTLLSAKLFNFIIKQFNVPVEVASIDECYLDVTSIWKKHKTPYKLAQLIQKMIWDRLQLPVSIGISNTKFVAKMSTQLNKPRGISIVPGNNFLKIFGSWPLIKYHGIGISLVSKLKALNINTIQDLAQSSPGEIKGILGKNTEKYILNARGKGLDKLNLEHNNLQEIGNSMVFPGGPKSNIEEITSVLNKLCKLVSQRMFDRSLIAYKISVNIRSNQGNQSKQMSLVVPLKDKVDILRFALKLLNQIWKQQPIYFLGVSLGKLQNILATSYQGSIFETNLMLSMSEEIVKKVNHKFQKIVVKTGKQWQLSHQKPLMQTKYIESNKIMKHFDRKQNPKK